MSEESGLRNRPPSSLTAWVLIGIGVYFLLSKFDWIPDLGPLVREWWPLVLIFIGVGMLVRRSVRDRP